MKLAIAQIGADIDAPSSLIDSGQYSVGALESLLKTWLHHAINQLQLDVSEVELLKGKDVCLDDISIELPDIELTALHADPKGYFERVFSPVIRRVLKHSIEVQLNAQSSAKNTEVHEFVSSVAELEFAHLDEKVMICLKEAFFKCITENKQAFLGLITSTEWPALRDTFIKALCNSPQQVASFIDTLVGNLPSTNVAEVVNKLSPEDRFSLWLDIESIYCANDNHQAQLQERIKVLAIAYEYLIRGEFNRLALNRVTAVLIRPQSDLKLLKTWFAIKAANDLTDNDRRTLARIVNRVLAHSNGTSDLAYILQKPLTHTSLRELITTFRGDSSPIAQQELLGGSQEKLITLPIYRQFKQGFKSSYLALQKLSKLLNHRSANLELPLFDRKNWLSLFTQADAFKDLPHPIYRLFQHIGQSVIYPNANTDKQHKKTEYLLKLVERELQAISLAPERLFNYVYANRIRALVCTFEDMPSSILKKLQNHCSAVRVIGAPLQQNVNLQAYTELLNELSCWLVENKHGVIQNSEEAQPSNEIVSRFCESITFYSEYDESVYVPQSDKGGQVTQPVQNAIASAVELQGPLSKLVAKRQTKRFEQAQIAQYRLALCVIKQGLNSVEKAILEAQMIGASTQILALMVQKFGAIKPQLRAGEQKNHDFTETQSQANQRIESGLVAELTTLCATMLKSVHTTCGDIERSIEQQCADPVEASLAKPCAEYSESQLVDEKYDLVVGRLKQTQLLEVLSRIRCYLNELVQQIENITVSVSLKGTHQLIAELTLCFISWKTLLSEAEFAETVIDIDRTIDKSLAKLQSLQKRILVLNPYLVNDTQKTSSWWGGLLQCSIEELTKLSVMGTDAFSEYQTTPEQVPSKRNDSKVSTNNAAGLIPTDLLMDLVSMQSASSYQQVQQILTQFTDRLEGILLKPKSADSPEFPSSYHGTEGAFAIAAQEEVNLETELQLGFVDVSEASQQRVEQQFYSSVKRIVAQSKTLMCRLSKQAEKHEGRVLAAGFTELRKQTLQALESAKASYQSSIEKLVSEDAGIVLLWPFLETLFRKFELLCEEESGNVVFCNEVCQQKAHQLLCYLVDTDPQAHETYAINAVLGLPLDYCCEHEMPLDDLDISELDRLLEVAILRWEALKGMPNSVFKEMFLHRNGEVNLTSNGVSIVVETKPQDILMMKLPWGLGIAQLPWLGNDLINIDWQYGI